MKLHLLYKPIAQVLLIAISITTTFILLEGLIRGYYFFNKEKSYDIKNLRQDEEHDTLYGLGIGSCSWEASLYPHPYLSFIQHNIPPCGWPTNNLFTHGNGFEEAHSDFVIMALGGSVVQQLTAYYNDHFVNWLEKHLNEKYISPKGNKFHVVTGAIGGWKHPNQIMMLARYHRQIDAFISLEGYNEIQTIQNRVQFDTPAFPYFLTVNFPDISSDFYHFIKYLKIKIDESGLSDKSYLAVLSYSKMKKIVGQKYINSLHESQVMNNYKLPSEWDDQKIYNEGFKQYANYITSLDALAYFSKKKGIVFMQPIPNLYKKLHPKDWPPRKGISTELYMRGEELLSNTHFRSLKFVSLLKVFENVEDWIYFDDIHCVSDHETRYSLGYDIMGEAMADHIATIWNFKKKL